MDKIIPKCVLKIVSNVNLRSMRKGDYKKSSISVDIARIKRQKWVRNGPKIGQEWAENRSRISQKWAKYRPCYIIATNGKNPRFSAVI